MINIHIIGNGTETYAIRSLLEANEVNLPGPVKVNIFGEYYFRNSLIYTLNNYLKIEDVIKAADVVICTDPIYEDQNIVSLCSDNDKPLFCTFTLENSIVSPNSVCIDGLNVADAASDLWINRLLDITNDVTSIEHFYGLQKLYDTGENALPGITIDEYRAATQRITGQPRLITLGEKYYYASEVATEFDNDIPVTYNWIVDTDHIQADKLDTQTEFIFHTVTRTRKPEDTTEIMSRSHMTCQNARSLSAWHYINASVTCSFIYMYMSKQLPTVCVDYNVVDHNTFSSNIFGNRFRIA
ncbi:MAG: hypothetical protein ACKVJK_13320 [Methylophagaceae bacterium]